ncbi:hypothetical protein UFOVP760_24 [uncultured Caudovirales phage]|uniref:Uncharacterized protein n=1 Tax=uncultured Caudovirales phage TaxID=2100421 RepID=A0A6J7X5G8_9CAUD|nr:hypothetical protein UFOVP760_24 [uncultured Caudovirales phage]
MNNLEQNINDLILWVKTTATTTQGFITEQTPLYIKEFLSWYFWEAIFLASVFGLLSVVLLIGGALSIKKGTEIIENNISLKYRDPSGYIGGGVIAIILGVTVSVGFFVNVHDALKVKIAPRVVIVDELTHKLRK